MDNGALYKPDLGPIEKTGPLVGGVCFFSNLKVGSSFSQNFRVRFFSNLYERSGFSRKSYEGSGVQFFWRFEVGSGLGLYRPPWIEVQFESFNICL